MSTPIQSGKSATSKAPSKPRPAKRSKRAATPRSRKTYRHGNLRQALIDEALILIRERGAEALNVREAARRIGVSHNAYTRHFADREALLAAISLTGHTQLAEAMRVATTAVDLPGTTPTELALERLRAGGYAYVHFALNNPAHYAAMYDHTYALGKYPELDDVSLASFAEMQALVETCQAGGLMLPGPAHSHACLCWSSAHGVVDLINSRRMHFDTPEEGRAFVDFAIGSVLGHWPFPAAPQPPASKPGKRPSARSAAPAKSQSSNLQPSKSQTAKSQTAKSQPSRSQPKPKR